MEIVTRIKRKLLRNDYINELNKSRKLSNFYNKGIRANGKAERILFWSTGGMVIQSNIEGAIACALKLRGHSVHMILCDGVYKACAKRVDFPEVKMTDWGKYCKSCIHQNSKLFEKLGIEYSYVSDLISDERINELRVDANNVDFSNYKDLTLNGIHLGTHLESAMMRHTRGGTYEGLDDLLKEYAFTILVNAEASELVMNKFKPTKVYMSHGIYADWGPALSVALTKKIPVISYICCYLTAHFFFGTINKFNETFLTIHENSWNELKEQKLDKEQKLRLEKFLERRYKDNINHDLKGILKEYKGSKDHYVEKYGLDKSKPVWGIMTHINWDAVSDYFPMLYKNFDEWLFETIKIIWDIKDVQWLIKIHPSEINDNPETGCQKFIEKNFPDLPDHIKILKMDDDISPLDFYSLLDGGVTVMGTGGLELSIQGKPVILSGEAHYSGKGFTYDASGKEHYKELLNKAGSIKKLDKEKLDLTWKYAYTYFIRKQIPLLPTIQNDLTIDFTLLDYLIPGKNKFMDFLCDRIADGNDFILPDKIVELTHPEAKEQIRNFS